MMDALLINAACAVGGALAGGLGVYFARLKIEARKQLAVPHIEIDGTHVPHPTILARQQRRAAQKR
jgi:hypothetical protein